MDKKLRNHLAAKAAELTAAFDTPISFAWQGNLSFDPETIYCHTTDTTGLFGISRFDVVFQRSEHGSLGTEGLIGLVDEYVLKITPKEAEAEVQ